MNFESDESGGEAPAAEPDTELDDSLVEACTLLPSATFFFKQIF